MCGNLSRIGTGKLALIMHESGMDKKSRRQFLGFASAALAAPFVVRPAVAQVLQDAAMRGAIDAVDAGFLPDAPDDQSRRFAAILQKASDTNQPVFLRDVAAITDGAEKTLDLRDYI